MYIWRDQLRMKGNEKSFDRKKNSTPVTEKDENENDLARKQNKTDNNLDSDNNMTPEEIDTHFQMYGKHAWEVEYGERCPVCDKRIDEYGFCACGSQGD
jgi:hypothetical protein